MALTPPPVAPPAAPPLPGEAPSRANPSTFRELADAFVVWQVGFRDWLAGLVTWLASYISWATTNVAEMDALQTQVQTDADAVASGAASAAVSAAAVQANRTALDNRLYPGTYSADPVTRPDGSAVQAGDRYFNSSIARQKTYSGTVWATDNLDSAALAATNGTTLLGWIQAGVNAIARTLFAKLREQPISVADYAGCDPTGATGSDAAFISALTYVASLARSIPAISPNWFGNKKILIPPGTYKLTQSASLLNSALFANRTHGLTFEGDGPNGSVVIIYDPVAAGPMMTNNDKLLYLRFKNIWFHGNAGASASNLLESSSSGGAQDYVWEDCSYSGTWQYGAALSGTDTNSEMKWIRCSWSGSWNAFLYVPAGGVDQFLNYWFSNCKYWTSSAWIDMAKGGSIKLTDCDISGYTPAAPTYLFNLRGNSHARGVTSFSAKGVRIEQKNGNAGVIYSEWEQGNISFTDCDMGSQAFQAFAAALISAKFNPGSNAGAHVSFKSCQIMGMHEFDSGTGGAQGQGRVNYENCDFLNYAYPDDAIVFSGTQPGRRPVVRMRNCGGHRSVVGGGGAFSDADVGWNLSSSCTVTRKFVSFKSSFGNLPAAAEGTFTVILPLNAIILRAIIDVPAGANTSGSTTAGYTMQMSDATPIAAVNFATYNLGGSVDVSMLKRCSTRAKATIQLIPNAGNDQPCTGTSGSVALVEYLG